MIRPIFNNKTQPSFRGTCIVNIPKNSFLDCNNIEQCFNEFSESLSNQVYKNNSSLKLFLLSLFKKNIKYTTRLIGEGYYDLKARTPYSDEWIRNHTGVELEKPLHKDFHSFYVFTKDEKDKTIKRFNLINSIKQETKLNRMQAKAAAQGKPYDEITMRALAHKACEDVIDEIIANKIDAQVLLKNLSEDEFLQLVEILKDYNLI